MNRLRALLAAALLLVAFAIPSPVSANQSPCQGFFLTQATIELPPGYWAPGVHYNTIRFVDPTWDLDDTWGPFEFTVSDSAPLYKGQVFVAAGLIGGVWTAIPDQTINPAQDTVLWAGWAFGRGDYPSLPAAYEDLEDASIFMSWDGGDEMLATPGPYASFCASYTAGTFHRTFGTGTR